MTLIIQINVCLPWLTNSTLGYTYKKYVPMSPLPPPNISGTKMFIAALFMINPN